MAELPRDLKSPEAHDGSLSSKDEHLMDEEIG